MNIERRRLLGAVLIVSLLGLWLRFPFIGANLPYFTNEDEGHHFNRVVEMVKEGRFDPQYFLKPSLHFYLRMPVVATAFLWNVKQGHLRSVQEIRTRDRYGLGGYAFTASHPGIVKWNRAFSVILSLAVIALTMLMTTYLTPNLFGVTFAGLLVAFSPALVGDSATIGVDGLMTLLCLLTCMLGVRFLHVPSWSLLLGTAFCAGLAVSSKYNAAPIALVPVLAVLCAPSKNGWVHSSGAIFGALILPVLSFFVGTPYALVSLPFFLDQVGYEVWHYGVVGHAGQMAEPGLPQLFFYLRWLISDGVGPLALILLIIGLAGLLRLQRRERLMLCVFPALFVLLMISQKTNFTRNMLVIIPFVGVLCALGISLLRSSRVLLVRRCATFIAIAALLLPLSGSIALRRNTVDAPESRVKALALLKDEAAHDRQVAVSGQLQLPQNAYSTVGVSAFDSSQSSPFALAARGFDRILVGPGYEIPNNQRAFVRTITTLPGIGEPQRVTHNPALTLLAIDRATARDALADFVAQQSQPVVTLKFDIDLPKARCSTTPDSSDENAGRSYCWLTMTENTIALENLPKHKGSYLPLALSIMTPWAKQHVQLQLGSWRSALFTPHPGVWEHIQVNIPSKLVSGREIRLTAHVTVVRSPASQGISQDRRRLGVAFGDAYLNAK